MMASRDDGRNGKREIKRENRKKEERERMIMERKRIKEHE